MKLASLLASLLYLIIGKASCHNDHHSKHHSKDNLECKRQQIVYTLHEDYCRENAARIWRQDLETGLI